MNHWPTRCAMGLSPPFCCLVFLCFVFVVVVVVPSSSGAFHVFQWKFFFDRKKNASTAAASSRSNRIWISNEGPAIRETVAVDSFLFELNRFSFPTYIVVFVGLGARRGEPVSTSLSQWAISFMMEKRATTWIVRGEDYIEMDSTAATVIDVTR